MGKTSLRQMIISKKGERGVAYITPPPSSSDVLPSFIDQSRLKITFTQSKSFRTSVSQHNFISREKEKIGKMKKNGELFYGVNA